MKQLFIVMGLILLTTQSAWATKEFIFYTYHNKPPYYLSGDSQANNSVAMLYQTFVDSLNAQQSEYKIKLVYTPRGRIDSLLKNNTLNGAVIGVNPAWFKDKPMEKYIWSDGIMMDKDVIITHQSQQFNYQHPRDLEGKRLALSRGLYYWGVTERVKENKIKMYETNADEQNLNMVKFSRVDATIMSLPTAQYFFKSGFDVKDFKILEVPHDQFERMILFPKHTEDVYDTLNEEIKKAKQNKVWLDLTSH